MKPCFYFNIFHNLLLALLLHLFIHTSSADTFTYGQHWPNGIAAVDHNYGLNGTFRSFSPLNYTWNYYEQYATEDHPFDKGALLEAANGSRFFTARDANGYLLCDPDSDLELDPSYCQEGQAFHEHNGIMWDGSKGGIPFTQLWFDDNSLARFMSESYGKLPPSGLSEKRGFLRWQVMDGNTNNWQPYNSVFFDTLALDGLYYLSQGNLEQGLQKWSQSVQLSEAKWDPLRMEFSYTGIHENYHMGLWKILTDILLKYRDELSPEIEMTLLQHSVDLRRNIIENQVVDREGRLLGWISNIGDRGSILNTESVSCNVLALGVDAQWVIEVDKNGSTFGNDSSLKWTLGSPGVPISPGNYVADIIIRNTNTSSTHSLSSPLILDITITDLTSKSEMHSSQCQISSQDLRFKNQWNILHAFTQVEVLVRNKDHRYTFSLSIKPPVTNMTNYTMFTTNPTEKEWSLSAIVLRRTD